jgi:Lrp/AsnC family transcriptional regulator, leucine-responsive regulatory protein
MVNKKDLLIVSHLRDNGRQTLTNMSKKTKIPISTIYDKIKFHDGGMIKKHTCLIDFSKAGFTTRAFVLFRVSRNSRDSLRETLEKHHNVNTTCKINNNYDFLAEVVFRQIKEVEDFLEYLEDKFKIKARQVFYNIEDIKRESFLAQPELLEEMSKETT